MVNGLYAVGECSCVSVHGANRLGTNSLLDLLVFGRAAGNHIVDSRRCRARPQAAAGGCRRLHARRAWPGSKRRTGGEYSQDVANDIRSTMQQHAGVFRTQASMDEGVAQDRRRCASASKRMHLKDKSKVFNTARVEALEVDNLIEVRAGDDGLGGRAQGMPRRAHGRDYERPADDPVAPLGRNDANWMKHTLWFSEGNRLDYKPVKLQAADRRIRAAEGAHVLRSHDTRITRHRR